jgi:hypothetical protein
VSEASAHPARSMIALIYQHPPIRSNHAPHHRQPHQASLCRSTSHHPDWHRLPHITTHSLRRRGLPISHGQETVASILLFSSSYPVMYPHPSPSLAYMQQTYTRHASYMEAGSSSRQQRHTTAAAPIPRHHIDEATSPTSAASTYPGLSSASPFVRGWEGDSAPCAELFGRLRETTTRERRARWPSPLPVPQALGR